jgi:predicted dehydrogenase
VRERAKDASYRLGNTCVGVAGGRDCRVLSWPLGLGMAEFAPIGMGIVGLGRRGLFTLERWLDAQTISVTVACDRDAAARELAATLCDCVVAEVEAVLDHRNLDAVLLALPVGERAAVAWRVLEAGKHVVFPDPPIASTIDEAKRLYEVAHRLGRQIVVWAPSREEPGFRTALSAARGTDLGAIRLLRFERWGLSVDVADRSLRAAPRLPYAFVGVLDQLMVLAGRPAERVIVTTRGEALLAASIELAGGALANICLHADAAVRLDGGWAFDAERGGYAAGRRWLRTAEGEIYHVPVEPLSLATPEEALRVALAGGDEVVRQNESLWLVTLLAAAQRSLITGQPADVDRGE